MPARKPDPRRTVRRFLKWLAEPPKDGECAKLELHPLEVPSVCIRNLVEALHDSEALALFLDNVFSLSEAALALGLREEAVLELVEGSQLRGFYVGGERKWLFSSRRIAALALAANQRGREFQGLRAAEQWFTAHGYRGFSPR